MSPEPDVINQIIQEFQVPKDSYHYAALTAGFINDTYLVSRANEPLYVLQRINNHVFKDVDGVMTNINQALPMLRGKGYIEIELIKTVNYKPYLHNSSGFWRMFSYIPNSRTYDTTTDPQMAYEAGCVIGAFIALLQNANPDDFVDTIPHFHDMEFRMVQFEKALASADPESKARAQAEINQVSSLLKKSRVDPKLLSLRVCHNDTKLNNVLFSESERKALCLIDLDTLMRGYAYFDFGDAVRTIVNTASEDVRDLSTIGFDINLFKNFVEGLAVYGSFLDRAEVDSLAKGTVFMPFIHGLRALTDFLMGNVYYKVAYPEQNLVRSRSLFHFANLAAGQQKSMQDVLYSAFGINS